MKFFGDWVKMNAIMKVALTLIATIWLVLPFQLSLASAMPLELVHGARTYSPGHVHTADHHGVAHSGQSGPHTHSLGALALISSVSLLFLSAWRGFTCTKFFPGEGFIFSPDTPPPRFS